MLVVWNQLNYFPNISDGEHRRNHARITSSTASTVSGQLQRTVAPVPPDRARRAQRAGQHQNSAAPPCSAIVIYTRNAVRPPGRLCRGRRSFVISGLWHGTPGRKVMRVTRRLRRLMRARRTARPGCCHRPVTTIADSSVRG